MFGEFLLQKKAINGDHLRDALCLQMECNKLFGQFARTLKGMTTEQVIETIKTLNSHNRDNNESVKFGEVAAKLGFLSPSEVEAILKLQQQSKKKIGEALVEVGALTPEECQKHLDEFFKLKNEVDRPAETPR